MKFLDVCKRELKSITSNWKIETIDYRIINDPLQKNKSPFDILQGK